jgi:dipeptidyl aminopeptidase/acylaminoacyl peptidase
MTVPAARVQHPARPIALACLVALLWPTGPVEAQAAASPPAPLRPMTFLDMQHQRSAGSPTPSPDGRWLLHTVTTPDWQAARSQTDIHLVSIAGGVSTSRRMTFTPDRNETSPAWTRDGAEFAFLSNRDATPASDGSQVYLMRPDGGEARRVTQAAGGVSDFAFSRDGRWLVFRAGKAGEQQLWRLPMAGIDSARPRQLTKQPGGVGSWRLARDGRRLWFVGPDTVDVDDKARREQRFTVDIRNQETPLASLWSVALDGPGDSVTVRRVAGDAAWSVTSFTLSDDDRWVGFSAVSSNRYERNITEQGINSDLFLLEAATGRLERLTENREVGEGGPSFSPDSRWVAFSAPDDLTRYSMGNRRLYLRAVDDRGGAFRKLGTSFDGDLSVAFWSADGGTIWFNEGWRATNQLFALDVRRDVVRQVTNLPASLSVSRDDDSGVLLVNYADPRTPPTIFAVPSIDKVATKAAWVALTDVNPQVRGFALGEEREITWTSTDGRSVGGILVLPVGYQPGTRYPLIVAIHGGPAAADVLGFNGGYGAQVYAGAGYAVLKPNYRGSTNYGEAHKTGIVGNYFPPGFDDIMTGVDHLIAQGIVDGDRMGALGWSAGGHWSNWILTHTDRFKAISSGAGTSNWISMYAQSDVQRNRQFYLGDELPYRNFDAYWNQSPLKYIENAKTPTMIHVVEGDPRVPSPQSVELHMALKKLGVPTELFMYPGQSHGIPDPRNRLVKSMSELAWMDYWVRGTGAKFSWKSVLSTLEEGRPAPGPRM